MEDLSQNKRRAVAWWLLAGVLMIIIQVLLGGVTRLTGSGLSITKWNPIFGILPPLNDKQWNDAFDGYKRIGQFKLQNSYYTISDFKSIFFWEWLHRFWARMLGIVFLVGFVYFLIKKYFDREMVIPFIILFILGGVQGLVGWIMVASGLNNTSLHVDHIRLAIHFISAMLLACYTFWFALQLLIPNEKRIIDNKLRNFTVILISFLTLQLIYGAFMAGLKAATMAPTWPTINGSWIPANFSSNSLISDPLNIHFIHRTLAYIILILIIAWYMMAGKKNQSGILSKTRNWPILLVCAQVALGILTVISAGTIDITKFGQFQVFAELHQLTAMFLLMSLVLNFYVVTRKA